MPKTVTLSTHKVIGTGDPMDVLYLIPLISSWGVPNQCVFCWSEGKEGQASGHISRLLCLDEPFEGHSIVGCCEAHWESSVKKHDAEEAR